MLKEVANTTDPAFQFLIPHAQFNLGMAAFMVRTIHCVYNMYTGNTLCVQYVYGRQMYFLDNIPNCN